MSIPPTRADKGETAEQRRRSEWWSLMIEADMRDRRRGTVSMDEAFRFLRWLDGFTK